MFRKIFFTILCLFVLSGSAFGAVYFVSSADGDDTDNGTTMDNGPGGGTGAWATVKYALESGGLSAGDFVFVRRTHSETFAADVTAAYNGTASAPITVTGWPRAAHSWDCDWVNGSTTIDNIDENDADREKHMGRFLTGPDGFDYLITKITDANTIIIDRPYAGTTAVNQVVSIKADENWVADMGTAYSFDDSGWTIKETTWDADADDLPFLDFSGGAFQIYFNTKIYSVLQNLDFLCGTDTGATLRYNAYTSAVIRGCLFYTTQNQKIMQLSTGYAVVSRCILVANSTGSNQRGINSAYSKLRISDSAIYGFGDVAVYSTLDGIIYFDNVNLGVEVANGGGEIESTTLLDIYGRDFKMDGTNGEITTTAFSGKIATIANYNKVLGAYKYFFSGGVVEKVAVTGTNANKKLSDDIIEITPNTSNTFKSKEIEQKIQVFESRKTYAAGTYNVKVWIYNDTGNTLNDTTFSDDICMRCRAEAANYDDTNPDSSLLNKITIAFTDDDPDTITDSDSGFVAAGFQINDKIRVEGSTSNDGEYTIAGVAAGTLTLVASDTLTAEIAGDTVSIIELPTKYVSMPWIYSDEIDIADAANADDWDYLQCDSVVVDQDGTKIYCEILVSTYDGEADVILIDPESSNP